MYARPKSSVKWFAVLGCAVCRGCKVGSGVRETHNPELHVVPAMACKVLKRCA